MGMLVNKKVAAGSAYNTIKAAPFDARLTVTNYEDLSDAEIWKVVSNNINYYPVYVGMITSVQSDKSLYILKSFTQSDINTAPTNMDWEIIGSTSATGPIGPTGPTGATGAQGPQGVKGDKGDTGLQGPTGEKGDQGEKGDIGAAAGFGSPTGSIIIDNASGVPSVTISATGPDTAKIFNFAFSGIKGEKGETGAQGPTGPKGEDGTGVTIKGSYESEEALKAAHPTGIAGDAYLVNGNLYVWSETTSNWNNVGGIKGPQGDQGPIGPTGADGNPGEKGSDGLSAYEIWKTVEGNEEKTKEDFLASLKGEKGEAATIAIEADVITGEPGTNAIVENIGDEHAAKFKFTIPQGLKGDPGEKGDQGPTGTFAASDWSTTTGTISINNGINSSSHVASGTITPQINAELKLLKIDMSLNNIIGRGVKTILLLGDINKKSGAENKYNIVYTSLDNNGANEIDEKTISIFNGNGFTKVSTGDFDSSKYKQYLIFGNSDETIAESDRTVSVPVPKFDKDANNTSALSINNTNKTLSLDVKQVSDSDSYAYNLSIVGDENISIYAPTSGGTSGHILVSKGSKAEPTWLSLESLHATADNFGTIKVINNCGLSLNSSGELSMAYGSTGSFGAVKVNNSNGLNISGGTISKSADSLSYTCDHKGTNKLTYILNGAKTSTDIDLAIDDGVIE